MITNEIKYTNTKNQTCISSVRGYNKRKANDETVGDAFKRKVWSNKIILFETDLNKIENYRNEKSFFENNNPWIKV